MRPPWIVVYAGLLLAWVLWQIHPAAAITGVLAVAGLAVRHRVRRRRHRREHPQAAGYLVYCEWGPNMTVDRAERLAREFPDVSATDRANWLAAYEGVDQAVWAFAGTGALPEHRELFERYLQRCFAFMDRDAQNAAWTLARYYAVKEGYTHEPDPLPPEYFTETT